MGTLITSHLGGLLLTLLLIAATNAFVSKPQAPTVSGRILCFFITDNVESFHYHVHLADHLVRTGYNVTVLGVLPLPMPFKHSPFVYQRLSRAEMQKPPNIYTLKDDWYEYAELDKNFEHFVQNQEEGAFDLVILAYHHNTKHLERAGCFRKPIILSTDTRANVPNKWELSSLREFDYLPKHFSDGIQLLMRKLNFCSYSYLQSTLRDFAEAAYYRTGYKLITTGPLSTCPTLDEVRRNIPVIFTNHPLSQNSISPHMTAFVSIDGIQIPEQPRSLPNHIAHFLNKSKQSVIYINLGTNTNCTQYTSEAYNMLYALMRETHNRQVLWKWTGECAAPEGASNILFEKCVPQNDILAHSKVELFITDGDPTSISEAQYHGVPMLALSFHQSQHENVQIVVEQEFGLSFNPYSGSFDNLRLKLSKLLHYTEFGNNIRKFSHMYRVRPQTPKQTVLDWVDYVLRYEGANYLHLPFEGLEYIEVTAIDLWYVIVGMPLMLGIALLHFVSLEKPQGIFKINSGTQSETSEDEQQSEDESFTEKEMEAEAETPESATAPMQTEYIPTSELRAANNVEELPVIQRVLTRNQKRRLKRKQKEKQQKENAKAAKK